jgi:hypothetical protein
VSGARYIIRSTCSDGTRHSYWRGICPVTGYAAWTRDPSAALRFKHRAHADAFAGACFLVGTGRRERYDVVELANSCAVSASGA